MEKGTRVTEGASSACLNPSESARTPTASEDRARARARFFEAAQAYQYYDLPHIGYVLDILLEMCEEDGVAVLPYIDSICSDEIVFDRVYARLGSS